MILPTFEDDNEVILQVEDIENVSLENDEDSNPQEEDDQPEESKIEADPLAKATYEQLVEKGIIDEDEAFDGSFEFIESKMEDLPAKLLKSAIDELPIHSQNVLKYIAAGGDNLKEDELKTFIKAFLNEDEVPDISTIDSARSFLENHLKSQGLRPNAIQAQLDDLEDSDELLDEAKKVLNAKPKKSDELLRAKEVEQEQLKANQKQFVESIHKTLNEDLNSWSKEKKSKVVQTIPKANAILNEVVKSPKAYVQLIDILTMFNGKEFDLENIKKQGEARTASALKDKITKSGFSSTKTVESDSTPDPIENLLKKGFTPVV